MIGFFGQLPKPGSVNTGPAPAAPAGGWPPFKGKPGLKQQQCAKNGGQWIGPTGKKWCQMPVAYAAPALPVPVAVAPPPTVGTPKYYPPPVDNSRVPPGEGGSPPGSPMLTDEDVVKDFITESGGTGPISMSAGAGASSPSGSMFSPALLVAFAAVGGVLFFVLKGKKGGKKGAARSKKRK